MRFTAADIRPMALGAAIMGSGGGGDPYLGEIMLSSLLASGGHVDIVSLDDLPDSAQLAPFALVGAPHAITEKLLGIEGIHQLFADANLRSRVPDAVVPYEFAGLNAMYPLAAAAVLGVPCADADATGRGVASLDTTVPALDGVQAESFILCDPLGRTVTVSATGALSMERLARPIVESMGSLALLSTSSLDVAYCRRHLIPGTVTRCLELGRLFLTLHERELHEIDERLATIGGKLLGSGTIVERISRTSPSGARTALSVHGDDSSLRVELMNEFHVVVDDGVVVASVPDIIVVVDRDTWAPLSVEDAGEGQDVVVIALPAPERWLTPEGLRHAGPRAHGYALDYTPFTVGGGL